MLHFSGRSILKICHDFLGGLYIHVGVQVGSVVHGWTLDSAGWRPKPCIIQSRHAHLTPPLPSRHARTHARTRSYTDSRSRTKLAQDLFSCTHVLIDVQEYAHFVHTNTRTQAALHTQTTCTCIHTQVRTHLHIHSLVKVSYLDTRSDARTHARFPAFKYNGIRSYMYCIVHWQASGGTSMMI